MRSFVLAPFLCSGLVAAQQIQDVWQTTWDKADLFSNVSPSTAINFVTPGTAGDADIQVADGTVYQTIAGFGGTLADSSALLLNNLKSSNSDSYWALLGDLFNPADGAATAGLTYIRVPLGSSDFSASLYSFDDTSGDTALSDFNIDAAPSYLFSVIKDIMSINSILKVHILPWSPPAWMKDGGTMDGGSLTTSLTTTYANYLLKCLQGFQSEGISVYAISIQNEPENSNPTYPTASMPVDIEAQIGEALRPLMNSNGFTATKLIGYEHNWVDAANYPVQLMQAAESSFDGVAFHCYEGTVDEQSAFQSAYPDKEIYQTECAGTIGSDWWSDIKWQLDNLYIGSLEYYSMSGMMWVLALDGTGQPELSGSNSCVGGCRGIVTINSDGSYVLNQEYYALAHASRAIVPKDSGGPFGQRIGVSVAGSLDWGLRVGAYVTGRVSSTDWDRYSLVVLNWDDSSSTTFNPVPISASIEFRGLQANYTFPVGVTTLWWYAESTTATVSHGPQVNVSSSVYTPWNTTLPSNVTVPPGNYRPRRSAPLL